MSQNVEVVCPCCEARLLVDKVSGKVVWQQEKATGKPSLEAIVSQLQARKSEAERKFDQEIENQKDRSRILEEKFKQAMERASKKE
jgi:hypothetical protein